MSLPRSVGLYVHFPYCAVRCNYCDFNTYVAESIPRRAYTQAVPKEGELRVAPYTHWQLETIYFGGGTPSLWGARGVGAVIEAARRWFPLQAEHVEITLECNPGEATAAALSDLRAAGVNRLSLGMQSLQDEILSGLNRRHSAEAAWTALDTVLAAGFDSVSADLMFALPGQSLAVWQADLDRVAATGVPHLSLYHLTLEEGTALTREVRAGRVALPDEDLQAEMWDAVDPVVARYGLRRYEISNFARPGHESRHNGAYWRGRPYLGLGAGAHSFLPPARWTADAVARRQTNLRHHSTWTRAAVEGNDTLDTEETLTRSEHLRERLFTGFRHLPGFSLAALADELGVDPREEHGATLDDLARRGLIATDGDHVALSPEGLRYADTVALAFF